MILTIISFVLNIISIYLLYQISKGIEDLNKKDRK